MIVSPPFLPPHAGGNDEAAWLDNAMRPVPSRLPGTQAPEGSFPLSHDLTWHNGMHLQAPQAGGGSLPVRAVAAGEVVFVNPPATPNSNVDDAQNYNPFDRPGARTAAWTDNGCVIVEHRGEIGVGARVPTEVVFYSVSMHLSALGRHTPAGERAPRPLRVGDRVLRKAELGTPGSIYGHAGQVHFEICLDDANLRALIGRAPAWVAPATLPAPTADGRIDAVYGSIWFYLPAETQTHPTQPVSHRRGAGSTPLGAALWLRMTYHGGDCSFNSFDAQGRPVGRTVVETDAAYTLSEQARTRQRSLPAASAGSASGWYELLRFGRNIGFGSGAADRDPLPADAAHWRRISSPSGTTLWADLNAPGSYKFSDADFPAAMGWNFIDDDSNPADQRCDSEHLKALIRDPDAANADRMSTAALARRLGSDEVRRLLRRTVCRFPSEWDRSTAEARYAFVGRLEAFVQNPEQLPRHQAHLRALAFDALPAAYAAATWHIHPREFIERLRSNGWLDADDLARIYKNTSAAVREQYRTAMNQVTRKYLYAASPLRLAHFLGQGAVESTSLRSMLEASMTGRQQGADFFGAAINPASRTPETTLGHWYGAVPAEADAWFGSTKYNSRGGRIASTYNWRNGNLGDPDAQKYRGRGFKQLTGRLNYSRYWVFRGWLDPATFDDSWWTDPAYIARTPARMRLRPAAVDDPQRAVATAYNCIDTGGWYLGSERPETLRQIDRDSFELATGAAARAAEQAISYTVTRAINGGNIQQDDRLRETRVAKEVLL